MTSFRILGPVEVWSGTQRVDIGGPRQISLLALLLLQAGRAISSDTLIDSVWGEDRAPGDNRLKMAIARLRKSLAQLQTQDEPPLRTVAGGYLLQVAPGAIDADVFRTLVSEGQGALEVGDAARAAKRLRAALALWRGPPLAELAFEDFAQAEIRRLEELRLSAIEARIDADLQLGRHSGVIEELEGLMVEEPVRERFAAQLMLALYRCGRQAEALDVYQRLRARLARDLGLEPGLEIRKLQSDILGQAASLQPAASIVAGDPTVPTQTVAPPLPPLLQPRGAYGFVGRQRERESLVENLRESIRSGRRAVFVVGDLGIGKTRLVAEFAAEARAARTPVLAGRCDAALDLPYQPFVDALEHLVEHAPQGTLERHVSEFGDSVARLVPALAARVGIRPAEHAATESQRYVLFRAIEGLLSNAAGESGLLLVLEDLHRADVPSLALLRRLLTSPKRPRIMLLSTCRLDELEDDHPLRDLLVDVYRESGVLRIELQGLASADVRTLLSSLPDTPVSDVSDVADALTFSTAGNPFLITELLRDIQEADPGGLTTPASVDRLPTSIAETLGRRLRRIDDATHRCLCVASVVGVEFGLDLVTELAQDAATDNAVSTALRMGILAEVPGAPLRLRFTHELTQRILYREVGPVRRVELHRRIAGALEQLHQAGRVPAAEVARHWLASGPASVEDALRTSTTAGDEALARLGPDEARGWYDTALELLERLPESRDAERCELLIRRGEAERHAGDLRFRDSLLEASALALEIGEESLLIRAALANTRGMQSETGVVDAARVRMLDAALLAVGESDSRARAQLLAMRAAELMYSGDWTKRVSMSDEALAIARRVDDPAALSAVLNLRFVTLLAPETLAERSANAVEAMAVAERLDDPLAQFFACHWRGYTCIEAADVLGARTWANRGREIAERFQLPTALWLSCTDQANLAIIAGEFDRAAALADEALKIGRRSEPDAVTCHAAQRASIAFETGQLATLISQIEHAVQANPGVPAFQAALALAYTAGDRHDEARGLLTAAAEAEFAALPYDVTWLGALCIYAHVSATLDEVLPARRLYELLSPWREQIAFPAFGVWGPVELYLGSLARTMAEYDLAQQHFLAASQAARRADAPVWQERAARELGGLTAGAK